MFKLIIAIGLGALIILDSIHFATTLQLKEILKKMALNLTALQQAETDHNNAIKAVSDHIDELIAKLGATDPADQAAIDSITTDIQAGTAALVAAATKGNPPPPTP